MEISVVIPVYNEEENLKPLFNELKPVLKQNYESNEIIFVDDGSTDLSLEELLEIQSNNSNVKIIEFEGNFGQSEAIQAGIDHSVGEIIVTMDSDMQNDPEDIPKLVEKLEKSNYDLINGWRHNRKDPFGKRVFSMIASGIRRIFLDTQLHDYGCTLKVFRKKAAKSLDLKGELHRYIPPLLTRRGYTVSELKVNHRRRNAGKTSYSWKRLPKGFIDMINVYFWQRYERRPLHIFGGMGILCIILGVLMFLIAIYQKINGITLSDTAATIISVFFILIGVQFFISGIIADIAIRNSNTPKKSVYNVRRVIE